jgi:hypothetical protein
MPNLFGADTTDAAVGMNAGDAAMLSGGQLQQAIIL